MTTVNGFTIRDYSNELSTFRVNSITLSSGNIAAQTTAAAALASAVENLSIGHLDKQTQQIELLNTPITPSNVYAQREVKWLVEYIGDTSGKSFFVEIAAPDLTANLVVNTDLADLSSTDWAAFVTAFEAFVKSPDNGTEAVTVVGARVVGRNL